MTIRHRIKAALPEGAITTLRRVAWPAFELDRRRARLAFAMSYFEPKIARARRWAKLHTESDNFNYRITDENKLVLAQLLAVIFRVEVDAVRSILDEIDYDATFHELAASATRSVFRDVATVHPGRRLGWYATVRLARPRCVVETGVDLGLGSAVICEALLRNAKEGHPGRYVGTDIRPGAGELFVEKYRAVGEVRIGDSIKTLETLEGPIDVFINDSDHSAEYEAREYEVIAPKLSSRGIVLGDNAHVTDKLSQFSTAHRRSFLFFQERPRDHWYPGAGIGFSFPSAP